MIFASVSVASARCGDGAAATAVVGGSSAAIVLVGIRD